MANSPVGLAEAPPAPRSALSAVVRVVGRPKLLAVLVSVLGAGLLVGGLALIYPPAALIVAGGGLLAGGLIPDYEPSVRPRRRR